MSKQPMIPPLIQNYIDQLNNTSAHIQVRMNHRDTLNNISNECFRAVKQFDKEQGIKTKIITTKEK